MIFYEAIGVRKLACALGQKHLVCGLLKAAASGRTPKDRTRMHDFSKGTVLGKAFFFYLL